ncbi:putative LRR receptor-like serine/threonine-protein kinase [Nymphaea thermarum]|nr:putative LRR receptor-like serine/threonine-protein kinase [Nymphaea thermarum]
MSLLPIFFAFLLLAFIPCFNSLTSTFNFPSFTNAQNLTLFGDAFINSDGNLDLTSTAMDKNFQNSTAFMMPAPDLRRTSKAISAPFKATCIGDGLAFFMAPAKWTNNTENNGYGLGIFNKSLGADNSQMIAVEFDTVYNYQFNESTDRIGQHMGIDINSYVSNATTFWKSENMNTTNAIALVQYDSTTGNLSSHMKDGDNTFYTSFLVDLKTVLPETVIRSPSGKELEFLSYCPQPDAISSPISNSATPNGPQSSTGSQNKTVIILVACLVPLTIVVVVIIIVFMRKRKNEKVELKEEEEEEEEADDFADMTMNFETGPRKFRYGELAAATNDFSEGGKLGQGGFGGVYCGTLGDTKEVVAVKRFSKGSSQGKKEYKAEVTVISRLRHRNLVRLIGWCHERGELLLVYEYMEGGSLDSHLFNSKASSVLPWAQRRKVALGLASAVLYLHDEWEQCVVHRDIKLSNVMVDSEFNARLGDFGLARLTNHGFAARTTMVAGTVGYLAPECVITGKFSTQSDVYSFGVVLLEIATGRRAIRPIGEKEARLVEWIWELYGVGSLLTAIDERLGSEFNEQEMERMMVVGLWCVHPDPDGRPTIREAIKALSLQTEVPSLPQKMPVPFYAPPPMNGLSSLFTSSSSGTTATTTSTTVSSTESAEVALLKSQG